LQESSYVGNSQLLLSSQSSQSPLEDDFYCAQRLPEDNFLQESGDSLSTTPTPLKTSASDQSCDGACSVATTEHMRLMSQDNTESTESNLHIKHVPVQGGARKVIRHFHMILLDNAYLQSVCEF